MDTISFTVFITNAKAFINFKSFRTTLHIVFQLFRYSGRPLRVIDIGEINVSEKKKSIGVLLLMFSKDFSRWSPLLLNPLPLRFTITPIFN